MMHKPSDRNELKERLAEGFLAVYEAEWDISGDDFVEYIQKCLDSDPLAVVYDYYGDQLDAQAIAEYLREWAEENS